MFILSHSTPLKLGFSTGSMEYSHYYYYGVEKIGAIFPLFSLPPDCPRGAMLCFIRDRRRPLTNVWRLLAPLKVLPLSIQ